MTCSYWRHHFLYFVTKSIAMTINRNLTYVRGEESGQVEQSNGTVFCLVYNIKHCKKTAEVKLSSCRVTWPFISLDLLSAPICCPRSSSGAAS